jgi:glyoxylase-like metal-dependent hydrolase (beta-lactamase superfamily II)
LQLLPEVAVVTAPNASPMTFTGTQSYLIGTDSLAIVDPGPDLDPHYDALIAAVGGRPVSHIIVTHSHIDHSPLSRRLSIGLDAPILGFGTTDEGRSETMDRLAAGADLGGAEGKDEDFRPDQRIADAEVITGQGWALEAIHTPGHLSNHLCFAVQGTGAVLSGDHVMGWATTMVSPPDGDLSSYMKSMEKMAARTVDTVYFPGHGGAVTDPMAMVHHQINHRKSREAQILITLIDQQSATPIELAQTIYTDVDQRLIPAAARNVFAHLIDLSERGEVAADRPIAPDARFSRK